MTQIKKPQGFPHTIRKLEDVRGKLEKLENGGNAKGYRLGLPGLARIAGAAPGWPIFMGGFPQSGKTELLFEILLELSELHGLKHVILTGEAGKVEEIYNELCHKAGRKPYLNKDIFGNEIPGAQNELERDRSRLFVNEHFVVIDIMQLPDVFRWDNLIQTVREYLDETFADFYYDTISVDPFYEIDVEDKPQTDQQLSLLFRKIYRDAQREGKEFVPILTNHIIKPDKFIHCNHLPGLYPMQPNGYQFAGGQMWMKKGYQVWTQYRPTTKHDYSLNGDGSGIPAPNELWLSVDKAKPKGLAKVAQTVLYYDTYKGRYYQLPNFETDHENGVYSYPWWEDEHHNPLDWETPEVAENAVVIYETKKDFETLEQKLAKKHRENG